MKRDMELLLLLVFLLLIGLQLPSVLFGLQVSANQESSSNRRKAKHVDEEIEIDCRAVIEHRGGNSFGAMIELPPLEGGGKYRLNITLVNPYNVPIQFSTVNLNSKSDKFVADEKEIPKLGNASFVMHLNAPRQFLDGRPSHSVGFSRDGQSNEVLKLVLDYELSNVFGFPEPQVTIRIAKSEKLVSARLPIKVIPPMTLDQLKLQVSENLRDINVKIVENDDDSETPYVLVEAPARSIPQHGIRGDVALRHPESDYRALLQLHIAHQETVKVRPESLRLTRDNTSKSYEATAMLRVTDTVDDNSQEKETDADEKRGDKAVATTPQIGLTIGGQIARVSIKRMGQSGIYQLSIRYDGQHDETSDDTVDVRWKIIVNGEEHVVNSHAFFPNR